MLLIFVNFQWSYDSIQFIPEWWQLNYSFFFIILVRPQHLFFSVQILLNSTNAVEEMRSH